MKPSGPALTNHLCELADRAGEAARNYRRGSIGAIGSYLAAGRLLAEARAECRRGQWGPFLVRAGLGERAARDMVRVARAVEADGVDAVHLHEAGGVRAWMIGRANPAAVAIVHRQAFDPDAGDEPAPGAAFDAGHETGDVTDNARERPSVAGEPDPAGCPVRRLNVAPRRYPGPLSCTKRLSRGASRPPCARQGDPRRIWAGPPPRAHIEAHPMRPRTRGRARSRPRPWMVPPEIDRIWAGTPPHSNAGGLPDAKPVCASTAERRRVHAHGVPIAVPGSRTAGAGTGRGRGSKVRSPIGSMRLLARGPGFG